MPTYPNIALMGRARSGKDTIAAHLIKQFEYTRVAFADPLKDMALRIDPYVDADIADGYAAESVRLSEVVKHYGWEHAKDAWPEVRRILLEVGQTVRDHDRDFWLRMAKHKLITATRWNLPVVVTDCRYPNEAGALRERGFLMVRVLRPDVESTDTHHSETALDSFEPDVTLVNNGSLAELRERVEIIAQS